MFRQDFDREPCSDAEALQYGAYAMTVEYSETFEGGEPFGRIEDAVAAITGIAADEYPADDDEPHGEFTHPTWRQESYEQPSSIELSPRAKRLLEEASALDADIDDACLRDPRR